MKELIKERVKLDKYYLGKLPYLNICYLFL